MDPIVTVSEFTYLLSIVFLRLLAVGHFSCFVQGPVVQN